MWLDKLTAPDMTPLGWLGRKTSTQTNRPRPSCSDWSEFSLFSMHYCSTHICSYVCTAEDMCVLQYFSANKTAHIFIYMTGTFSSHIRNIKTIWSVVWENRPLDICAQRRLRSACASAQADQSLRCPLEETSDPFLSKERQRRLWADSANAQTDLSLR